jgi:hypothetical protein
MIEFSLSTTQEGCQRSAGKLLFLKEIFLESLVDVYRIE